MEEGIAESWAASGEELGWLPLYIPIGLGEK